MNQDHEKSDIPNSRHSFLTAGSRLTMADAVGPMIGLLTLFSIAFAWQRQARLSRASVRIQAHASRLFALSMLTIGALRHATFAAAASSNVEPSSSLVATCAACHGAAGQGSAARGIPRLAGQNADYMAHALSKFKDGSRASPVMQSVAHNLSDSDIRELADYFAVQHPPIAPAMQSPHPAEIRAGQQLAQFGDGANVAACFSCHAADGKGNGARFPSVAGQPASFIIARLHEFQARAKKGGVKPGSMTAVAAQMMDTQIEAAASYLSTLPR
jgi:cytochrome c553